MKPLLPGFDRRPFWIDNVPQSMEYQSFSGEDPFDVIVVGGGFTGLSCAIHLLREGYRVAVFEAARVGAAASGRNGGLLIPGLRREVAWYLSRIGRDRTKALLEATEDARCSLLSLIEGHECFFANGHLHAAVSDAHSREVAEDVEALHGLGYVSIKPLDREAAAGHCPEPSYPGGSFDSQGGWLQPYLTCQRLADEVVALGGRIFEGTLVDRILQTGVVVNGREVRSSHVAIASDAFAGGHFRPIDSRIMPVGNQLIATEPLGDHIHRILPTQAAVSDTKFVLDYFRPTPDGRLVFGGGEKYTPAPPQDIASFVRPYLERTFPSLRGVRITHAWHGVVSVTMTRDPVIGSDGNVFWSLGYSGQGVVLAHLGGLLMAEAIQGRIEGFEVASSLSPPAWPGGPMARDPLYVAGMLWYAFRDRLGRMLSG
jgi:gamma-glutamylputrescine oxidase